MPDEKDVGFKVTDRRKFNPDGTPRVEGAEEAQETTTPELEPVEPTARVLEFPGEPGKKKEQQDEPVRAGAGESAPVDWSAGGPRSHDMPEPTLENLINMLAVEAIMHLGLIENPAGERSVDLGAARHVIDLLGMLEQKTRGNLRTEEADLIDGVLADLRMQFVAVSRTK